MGIKLRMERTFNETICPICFLLAIMKIFFSVEVENLLFDYLANAERVNIQIGGKPIYCFLLAIMKIFLSVENLLFDSLAERVNIQIDREIGENRQWSLAVCSSVDGFGV